MREIYVDQADGSGPRRLFGDRACSVGDTAGHLPDGMLQFQSGGAPNRATSVSTIHENFFHRVPAISIELIINILPRFLFIVHAITPNFPAAPSRRRKVARARRTTKTR